MFFRSVARLRYRRCVSLARRLSFHWNRLFDGRRFFEHAIADDMLCPPRFHPAQSALPSTGALLGAYAGPRQIDPRFTPRRRPAAGCNMTEIDLADPGDAAASRLATAVCFDTPGRRPADVVRPHARKHGVTQGFTLRLLRPSRTRLSLPSAFVMQARMR